MTFSRIAATAALVCSFGVSAVMAQAPAVKTATPSGAWIPAHMSGSGSNVTEAVAQALPDRASLCLPEKGCKGYFLWGFNLKEESGAHGQNAGFGYMGAARTGNVLSAVGRAPTRVFMPDGFNQSANAFKHGPQWVMATLMPTGIVIHHNLPEGTKMQYGGHDGTAVDPARFEIKYTLPK
jgi:hypothetical protein